jgi:hypothetical protein
MDNPLIDLMHDCVVQLTLPGKSGTGFFVAPGRILTCAHVVGDRNAGRPYDGEIQVRWKGHKPFATGRVILEKWFPQPDIALIEYTGEQPEPSSPPCVLLGQHCETRHPLATFGYKRGAPNGDPATFECNGYTGDEPPLIRIKLDNIQEGMSGSPLLNLETKRVCGMIRFTVDPGGIAGGGGVSAKTIFDHLDELAELQDLYHRRDIRWYAAIGVKTPGDLSDLVKNEIAEVLAAPTLNLLSDHLRGMLREKKAVSAIDANEMTSWLVKSNTADTLPLLYMAQKKAAAELEKRGARDETVRAIQNGVHQILGWLVLLTVNVAWLRNNRGRVFPEDYPGAIDLPVKTDFGIEVIHAAMNERCARFGRVKGTLFGANRMPGMDHHFLESGILTVDVVNEVKRSICLYLNTDWGEERVPDRFGPDENEELNARLRFFNQVNESRYLVISRSDSECFLNDDVYRSLKDDLPDLQVVFHSTGGGGTAFTVSEISLHAELREFFSPKQGPRG